MNGPVVRGVIPGGDEYWVSLGSGDTKHVNRGFLDINLGVVCRQHWWKKDTSIIIWFSHPINLNNRHVMTVDPEIKWSERRSIKNPQTVRLSRNKRQSCICVETHGGCGTGGMCSRFGRKVRLVLGKVNQTRVYLWFLLRKRWIVDKAVNVYLELARCLLGRRGWDILPREYHVVYGTNRQGRQ